MQRILVIKLGALGDFFHAFHAFAAIRAHHRADRVTLLTTPPYAQLATAAPWFDDVRVDPRAPWWDLAAAWRAGRLIRGFDFVYDLQTSRRSARYFRLAGRPAWSGIAPGCSHPHANPGRDRMHTVARQREQLSMAGIAMYPNPERSWLTAGIQPPGLPRPYVLLVPGGAGVGSVKRWPVACYAALANGLAAAGLHPVVIGGAAEATLAHAICAQCPAAIDLTDRTPIPVLAALATRAALVIGNDTGPLHVLSASGAQALALFSASTAVAEAGPLTPGGQPAAVIDVSDLAQLPAERVLRQALAMVGAASA